MGAGQMKKSRSTGQMQDMLDINLIHKYINQMYRKFHIPITLCDAEGTILTTSDGVIFCKYCTKVDGKLNDGAFQACASKNKKESPTYTCPYGFKMHQIPIKMKNKATAYVIIFQYLNKDYISEDTIKKPDEIRIDDKKLIKLLETIPVISEEELNEIILHAENLADFILDMNEKNLQIKKLKEEVLQNSIELQCAQQEITDLKMKLSIASNDLDIKSGDLSCREMRYRFLFSATNQGILLLRKETFSKTNRSNEYSIVDINPEMQIIVNRLSQEGAIPDNNLMKSDIIKHILSKNCGNCEVIDSYYDKRTNMHFYIQSKALNKYEIMICVTDKTSVYELLKDQKAQIWKLVFALGSLIKKRDLYTADHQKRVAVLAAGMAIDMGLDKKTIESIFIAGMLHDIGKISIPFEILTKPDQLTKIEYEFMKTHVQCTYDILKNINFTLPIAEIAFQHHERLDGSGYPRNLKGEEIIVEAKILAVADVYDAITAHRPYRPSMGIEYALHHLKENSGILYDADVVNSCVETAQDNAWDINKLEKYLKYKG